jgi:Lhr-like helicase
MSPPENERSAAEARLTTLRAVDSVGEMTPSALFHPAVAAWFSATFPGATQAQARAWPAIQAGRHVLVAAPTGSGKTLAAFLAAIDGLVRQGGRGRAAR